MTWTPAKKIRVDLAIIALGLLGRPVNAAKRARERLRVAGSGLLGRVLSAAGIRRDPGEGPDGSPR